MTFNPAWWSEDFTRHKYRDHPFVRACSVNDLATVTQMLQMDSSLVRLHDEDGSTPLFTAARDGRFELASVLIEAGADVNATDKCGKTPLQLTALTGNVDLVRLLLTAGARIGARDSEGWSALRCAIHLRGNRRDVAEELLKNGAIPDLGSAIRLGLFDYVRNELYRNPTAIPGDRFPTEPLMEAIAANSAELVELLLAHGANPNETPRGAPLCLACSHPDVDLEIIKSLLNHGANPFARCQGNHSVIEIAEQLAASQWPRRKPFEVVELLKAQRG